MEISTKEERYPYKFALFPPYSDPWMKSPFIGVLAIILDCLLIRFVTLFLPVLRNTYLPLVFYSFLFGSMIFFIIRNLYFPFCLFVWKMSYRYHLKKGTVSGVYVNKDFSVYYVSGEKKYRYSGRRIAVEYQEVEKPVLYLKNSVLILPKQKGQIGGWSDWIKMAEKLRR